MDTEFEGNGAVEVARDAMAQSLLGPLVHKTVFWACTGLGFAECLFREWFLHREDEEVSRDIWVRTGLRAHTPPKQHQAKRRARRVRVMALGLVC